MSEQNDEKGLESPQEPVSGPVEGEGAPEASQGGTEPSGAEEPNIFPRSYVEELREENARHRTKAKRSEQLTARLVTAYAAHTGKLADPEDLPFSEDLLDDEGMPERTKVVAAVDELLTRKPHLAAVRPSGNVGQGARGTEGHMVSLADLLRAGAD